jgi:hypothetical protein
MDAPSYYAIIPANVRYSKVTPNAKLLYGEITALASKSGVCWATNGYFAGLYETSIRSVQRWLYELHDAGFIVLCEAPSGARGMRLSVPFIRDDKNVMPPDNLVVGSHDKNVTQNNTSVNNTEKIPPAPKGEPDGFEEIWKARWSRGPQQHIRARALKAYLAALKRGHKHEDLLVAVKACAGVNKAGTEYAPMLSTWLNEERWKDAGGAAVVSAADMEASRKRIEEARIDRERRLQEAQEHRRRQMGLIA